ncbi:MAG: dihydroorotate dehydrogenase [Proteobacteria bacterium]|nr:dihydroorotate dehydrogenase [Pseudomonadota bacterium]
MTDLSVRIGDVVAKNPVMLASGTAGYGPELSGGLDMSRLGGFVTKGIAVHPWEGNAPPRIAETPGGMLNAIGLQNVGLEAFLEDKVPYLNRMRTADTVVAVNVIGKTVQEYHDVAKGLRGCDAIDALELNISCPNIKEGGIAFGTDCVAAAEVTAATVEGSDKPVWVKLSPNVADIASMGVAVEEAGAAALSVINTLLGMAIDLEKRRPLLSLGWGGLSGPAIKPVALRMTWQVSQACSIPVLGMGGIRSAKDALEFMVCGATAVQIGTANFANPNTAAEVVDGMTTWCDERGIERISEIVGTLNA